MVAYVDVSLSIPDGRPGDWAATKRQVAAVCRAYGSEIDGLTSRQAHAILSYKEYAVAVVDDLFGQGGDTIENITIGVAAYVSNNPDVAKAVVRWSERNFDAPAAGDAVIRGTKYFRDVATRCVELAEWMRQNGGVVPVQRRPL